MGTGHALLIPTSDSCSTWQRPAHFILSPTSVSSPWSLPLPSLLHLLFSHLQQPSQNASNTSSVNEFCCHKFFFTNNYQAHALGPGPTPFGSPGWGAEWRSEQWYWCAGAGRCPGWGQEMLSRGQHLGVLA